MQRNTVNVLTKHKIKTLSFFTSCLTNRDYSKLALPSYLLLTTYQILTMGILMGVTSVAEATYSSGALLLTTYQILTMGILMGVTSVAEATYSSGASDFILWFLVRVCAILFQLSVFSIYKLCLSMSFFILPRYCHYLLI